MHQKKKRFKVLSQVRVVGWLQWRTQDFQKGGGGGPENLKIMKTKNKKGLHSNSARFSAQIFCQNLNGGGHDSVLSTILRYLCTTGTPKGGPWHNRLPPKYSPVWMIVDSRVGAKFRVWWLYCCFESYCILFQILRFTTHRIVRNYSAISDCKTAEPIPQEI